MRARGLRQEGDELVNIRGAEDGQLGKGQCYEPQPLRGRLCGVDCNLEAVGVEHMHVVDHKQLVARGQMQRQWREQPLRVDLRRGLERLEAVLLIRRMLVDAEQVTLVQPALAHAARI